MSKPAKKTRKNTTKKTSKSSIKPSRGSESLLQNPLDAFAPLSPSPIEASLIQKVLPILENYDKRLLNLETKIEELGLKMEKLAEKTHGRRWTEDDIYPYVREAYFTSPDRLKDLVPIPSIAQQVKAKIAIELDVLEDLLYALFIQNKIDLQPGKTRTGQPLIRNNHSFYWLKILGE